MDNKELNSVSASNLDELEEIMMNELRFYSDPNNSLAKKGSQYNITDRMCKAANVVLATENLKERKFMNRTERKAENRKLEQAKK